MDWVKKKKDFGYAFRNVWITGKEEVAGIVKGHRTSHMGCIWIKSLSEM